MFCTACGTRNTPESRFCANCGQVLGSPAQEPNQAPIQEPVPPIAPPGFPTSYAPPQQPPPAVWFAPSNPYADVEHMRRFAAEQKSFTTPAIITLVLYILLWVPGLIANIVYLVEARKIERMTGRAPEGMGCLWALIIVVGVLGFLGICVWFLILAGAASSNG